MVVVGVLGEDVITLLVVFNLVDHGVIFLVHADIPRLIELSIATYLIRGLFFIHLIVGMAL